MGSGDRTWLAARSYRMRYRYPARWGRETHRSYSQSYDRDLCLMAHAAEPFADMLQKNWGECESAKLGGLGVCGRFLDRSDVEFTELGAIRLTRWRRSLPEKPYQGLSVLQ
jgi:hypothetical protein